MTTLEILKAARAKIERPGTWAKHTLARDARGREISPCRSTKACKWCALGAVFAVLPEGQQRKELALHALEAALPERFEDVGRYNDVPGRKQADILALFDRAIASQEAADADAQ